jgi:hypothetical protein
MTVREIEEVLDTLEADRVVLGQGTYTYSDGDVYRYDIIFSYESVLEAEDEFVVPGLGTVKHVDNYGGEGMGDQYFVVFEIVSEDGLTRRMFKKNGYYASHDGAYLDGRLFEVKPVQKTITVYEAV